MGTVVAGREASGSRRPTPPQGGCPAPLSRPRGESSLTVPGERGRAGGKRELGLTWSAGGKSKRPRRGAGAGESGSGGGGRGTAPGRVRRQKSSSKDELFPRSRASSIATRGSLRSLALADLSMPAMRARFERGPDEEGIETCTAVETSRSVQFERGPDEEGIETAVLRAGLGGGAV